MKVGILTFHYSNHNFGAVLQTYSLYKYVESLGYEPYIINYSPKIRSLKGKVIDQLMKSLGFRFEKFRNERIPNILSRTTTNADLRKLNQFLDVFIVGSDQVWRYRGDKQSIRTYFFDFVDKEKLKISYAASFGIETWNAEEAVTHEIAALAKRFDAVSVRESSGVKICKNDFGVDAVKVLDPTLILDRSYFEELAASANLKESKRYLAYMILDETSATENFFRQFASNHQLKFIRIKGKRISMKKHLFLFNRVEKWLSYLKNADLIVTDSFHCVVFSLIFRKKFVCLANSNRGTTRLVNLLKMVNLEDRFFTDAAQIEGSRVFEDIDFERVERALTDEQLRSVTFLKSNLAAAENRSKK